MSTISIQEILDFQDAKNKRLPMRENEGDGKRMKLSESNGNAVNEEDLLKAIEEDDSEPLDETAVRKLITNLEKKLLKNQEMRIKFPEDPSKFMESEIELNVGIQELHALATMPDLYHLLLELNAVGCILQLMSHENTDIIVAVIHLLQELTDVDSAEDGEEGVRVLVGELLGRQLIALLVQIMDRLDESNRDEFDGVNNALSVVENVMEVFPEKANLCVEQGLVLWLLKRVRQKGQFDGNKLYASELIAVILQQSEEARNMVGSEGGIDILLQALASYKRHNPGSVDEKEFMENLFDALCACLLHTPNRKRFLDGEGMQLMNLMLREKKDSRPSALKVLDYATTGPEGKDNCDKFVEILGLRTLFPLFMKTPPKGKRKETPKEEHEEHVCAVIGSLLRNCSSSNRGRILDKFVEQDHAKVDRLVELFLRYSDKVKYFESKDRAKKADDEDEDDVYLRKLDAGLFTLQLISLILADVSVHGSSSIRQRVAKLMAMKGGHIGRVKHVMKEYNNHLGEDATDERKRTSGLMEKI